MQIWGYNEGARRGKDYCRIIEINDTTVEVGLNK